MTEVVRCPVCGGNGQVPNGFYSTTRMEYGCLIWASGSTEPEKCQSCNGKGYVLIDDKVGVKDNEDTL